MAANKNTNQKIESVKEKIRQLQNQEKRLVQQQKEQERKARTKRLIERGAILESLIDGAEALTNEQVKTVLSAALNSEAALESLVAVQEPQKPAHPTEPALGQRESAPRAGA